MEEKKYCPICKKPQSGPSVDVCQDAYNWIIKHIKAEHPHWVEKDGACPRCVEHYKKLEPKSE